MKGLRTGFIVFAAALITFGLSGMAFAFHSGGVAECMGCHNIHDGKSTSGLLIASDPSSSCANATCHGAPSAGSYHILTPTVTAGVPPLNKTPGGDFGWLLKTYTWSPRSGSSSTDKGQGHGHNIVATDLPGYVAADNVTAPGGGPTIGATFSCTDCHDQHGKLRRLSDGTYATTGAPIIASGSYNNVADPLPGQAVGAYRLLRGPGSGAGPGGVLFPATAIFKASAPSSYNRAETGAGGITKVAYGGGVSEWCATCHPDMHSATSAKLTHPVSQGFGAPTVINYNQYLGSGLVGASGFDTLVPYQLPNGSTPAELRLFSLDNATKTLSATSSRVMCLSCHRAHASGFEFMGRWNNAGEFIAVDGVWPGTDSPSTIATAAKYAQGRTTAETLAAYNGIPMPYASYQRSLCNKCHAKD